MTDPKYHLLSPDARPHDARTPIKAGRDLTDDTQEKFAELLNVDPRTLRRYETGELPTPDDIMFLVSDMTGQPILLYRHFKEKYGIRDDMMPPVQAVPLALATVNLLTELEKLERHRTASRLLELAQDGVIDPAEEKDFAMIQEKLDGVRRAVELLRYCRRT